MSVPSLQGLVLNGRSLEALANEILVDRCVDSLGIRQADFAAAILDPARPIPSGLVGPDGIPSSRRFNVYRNNVVASLIRVLRAAFPVTARIVGEEFFTGMARTFVSAHPPESPMLLDYGVEFPDFIRKFEPVATLPYLHDIARVERAWCEAYYAREARSIVAAAFAQVRPDDLPGMRVTLHPSLRVVRSAFPIFSIWQTNRNDAIPQNVNLAAGGEDTLIVRPDAEIDVRALAPGGADFLHALSDGTSMLEAASAALAANPRFDLSAHLSELIGARVFVDIELPPCQIE